MHIGYITSEYPIDQFKDGVGGIGTFTKAMAESLVKKNIAVSVFVHSQSKNNIFRENGVTIYFVKRYSLKGLTWITNRLYFNNCVNKIIKDKKINIIEAPEWTGFTAFMKFRIPLVIRLHGSDTFFCDLEKRRVKSKNKFYEKKAILGADKVIGVSNFVSKKTKELFNIKKQITTIYNAIDTTKFTPSHKNIEPSTLLYFGSIIRKKGVLKIAEMFNELFKDNSNVKLVFLGRDTVDNKKQKSTIELIKELITQEALKSVSFINAVPYNEVIKFINQSDIIILPSFGEAFPMSWLEAMAMEKKMITSDIGWAKELMIDGETGYMVDPNDIDGFKNSVLKMLTNSKKTLAMSKSARKRIQLNFELSDMINKNVNFYKKVINDYIIS